MQPDNLGVLARDLRPITTLFRSIARNHGLSPRDPVTGSGTARDLLDTLDAQQIEKRRLLVIPWAKSGNGADGAGARSHRSSGRD